MATAVLEAPEIPEAPPEAFRKTLWLAGPEGMAPQFTVFVPGRKVPYKFCRGRLTITNEDDYRTICESLFVGKNNAKAFAEDWPEDRAPVMHKRTGYAPRSYAALQAHEDLIDYA